MTLNMNAAVTQLRDQIVANSSSASPADLAYLTQAMTNLTGQATPLDLLQKSDEYQLDLKTSADKHKDDLLAITSKVAKNGLVNMELVDSKLIRLTSRSNLTSSNDGHRALVDAGSGMFGALAHFTGSGGCGAFITPISVGADGSITASDALTVWENTSYSGISTTAMIHSPGTGRFICPGYATYPGRSNHGYGYGWGLLRSDGTLASGYMVDNNGSNYGSYLNGVESGDGFAAVWLGINGSTPYRMRCDFSGSAPAMVFESSGANSSTGYTVPIVGQTGVSAVLDGLLYIYVSNQPKTQAIKGANSDNRDVTAFYANDIAFVLSNGNVVHFINNMPARLYTGVSDHSEVNEVFPIALSTWSTGQFTSVGKDRWMILDPNRLRLVLFDIDPVTCHVKIVDQADIAGLSSSFSTSSASKISVRPTPDAKHLVVMSSLGSTQYCSVQVYKNPLDFTIGQES